MATINWAYIAGFFDGEGCISIKGQYHGCSVGFEINMTQVNKIVLERIQEFLITQGIPSLFTEHKHDNPKWKTSWRLIIRGGFEGYTHFIGGILPYLIVKKTLAQDCLRYMRMYPNRKGMSHIWRHRVYKRNVVLC